MTDGSINETSTSQIEKRTNLAAGTFLKNKHPELFEFSPRPGGFYRHLVESSSPPRRVASPPSRDKKTFSTNIQHDDIQEILATSVSSCARSAGATTKIDQKNDTVKMSSIGVSTVMMLAQKTYQDISVEHVRHSQEYFRGLKQSDGYPKNVGQLVQLLSNLKTSGKICVTLDDEEQDQHYADHQEEQVDAE